MAAVASVMIVTILIMLMLQLQSMSRMAMVFMTPPLGLIGVVIALLAIISGLTVATFLTNFFQPALKPLWQARLVSEGLTCRM